MTGPIPPLTGVRVLDLSRLLPGAFCTHILRELGAGIIKIEPPGGDPLRRLAPIASRRCRACSSRMSAAAR